ncbi:MAG TPA: hypothetical protein VFQ32_13890 [Ktedonobacterales bacterium]|nr:hypothetical protein [Ktedonobacterales bacterium]
MTPRLSKRIQRRLARWRQESALLSALPGAWSKYRIAPILALVLALAALFASTGAGAGAGSHPDSPTTRAGHAVVGALPAGRLLIGSADFHLETVSVSEGTDAGDTELEMNLAISQTASDCQTPLYGEFCLRYDILLDDAAVQAGYGLIPLSDVSVTASSVTLRVDTRHEPHVTQTQGDGGLIQLTWALPAGLPRPALHATGEAAAAVRGSLIGHAVPANGVTASVLVLGSA